MARFKSPNSGDIIEIEDDYDTETGVNRSAQKAQAKGWQSVHSLTSKSGKTLEVDDDALDSALAKGWQLSGVAQGAKQADAQYVKDKSAQLDSKSGMLESGVRKVAQGGLFGLADEFAGGISAVTGEGYGKGRDQYRQDDMLAEKVNPKSSMAGTVGSVLASLPAASASGLGALVKTGAASGGLSAFGEAEGSAGEIAGKTLAGTVTGAVIPAALKGAGAGVSAGYTAAKKALDPSELRAKVISSMLKDFKGPKGAAYDTLKSKVMTTVKDLEARGWFNGPGTNTRAGLFNKADDNVGQLNDEAQRLLDTASPNANVSKVEIFDQLDKKALEPWYQDGLNKVSTESELGSKVGKIDELMGDTAESYTLGALQRIKRGLQKRAKEKGAYKSVDPTSGVDADVAERAGSAVRQALEEGVEKGLPGAGPKFRDANKFQSELLSAQEMLGDSMARNTKNMPISLTTGTSMGGAGALDGQAGGNGIFSTIAAGANLARQPWARLVLAKLGDKIQDSEQLKRTLAFLTPLVEKSGEAVLNSKTISAAARMAGVSISDKD